MHELALAQNIIDVVEQQATLHKARRVTAVHVLIGDAVAVDPDSLSFCFELLAGQTALLDGASLAIEGAPHRACCRDCGAVYTIMQYMVRCPACQSRDAEILSGTEFEVRDMDVDND